LRLICEKTHQKNKAKIKVQHVRLFCSFAVSKDGELRANLPGLRVWEDEKPVPDVVVAWGATVWGAPDGEGTLT
jgi:hypothetical protein